MTGASTAVVESGDANVGAAVDSNMHAFKTGVVENVRLREQEDR